jgi:hypothetical protein
VKAEGLNQSHPLRHAIREADSDIWVWEENEVRAPRSGTDCAKRSPGGVRAEGLNQPHPLRHVIREVDSNRWVIFFLKERGRFDLLRMTKMLNFLSAAEKTVGILIV